MKSFKPLSMLFLCIALFGASMRSIAQETNHWEMVVENTDTWHYFIGNQAPPINWSTTPSSASDWDTGTGGIGYGDDDDGTVIGTTTSVYLRTEFQVLAKEVFTNAILEVDYDDGFIAYLNGHEIARANMGDVNTIPTFDMLATGLHEASMYSGGNPERFVLPLADFVNYLNVGENILAVEVHNAESTSSDLSSNVFFMVGVNASSLLYKNTPNWFNPPFDGKLNLPIVAIETNGQEIVDEPKITAHMRVIDHGNGMLNSPTDPGTDFDGTIGIEIRGQSSQMFPKKSFSVELRNDLGEGIDASLLGMPLEEDWVLYAPYSDKTMVRNAITYQLGQEMGRWQPRFRYCEVYLNGIYHGIYLLIEKIKRGADRVDINKLKVDEISGDDLTGGYIVKVDKTWDISPSEYFYTNPTQRYKNARNYAFTYVYPKFDDIVVQQKNFISSYLTQFENTLNGDNFSDPELGYAKYIDVESFIDFQIMNEFSNNVDGYRYSTFFHKQKESDGGKLFAGPLWDFNLGYGNLNYENNRLSTKTWLYTSYGPTEDYCMHWWARLMEDPTYKNKLASRWNELRSDKFSNANILKAISDMVTHLGPAIDRNFDRWPILGTFVWPNNFIGNTYAQEVEYLENWMLDRLEFMDAKLVLLTALDTPIDQLADLRIYPNPVTDHFTLQFDSQTPQPIQVKITDITGRVVFETTKPVGTVGAQEIRCSIPRLIPAYYTLSVLQNGGLVAAQLLKVH